MDQLIDQGAEGMQTVKSGDADDAPGSELALQLTRMAVDLIEVISDVRGEVARAELAAGRAEARASQADAQREAIERSTSWRVTAPLRSMTNLFAGRRAAMKPHRNPAPPAGPGDSQMRDTVSATDDLKQRFRDRCSRDLDRFLASGERLSLPTTLAPRVSIVMVVFNQAELTFACLTSLAREVSGTAEVIILDNASTDRTRQLLDRIDGATVIRMDRNLHFVHGVNRAADAASGRHLLLLNNDTEVAPGAVAAAAARLDAEPDLGAVGGPIVHLDGKLQEAGAIVWRDGHSEGYGRGEDPEAWEFRFRRDVDYCSGAFLMVRRDLFDSLGRLDTSYSPAYFEDTDLCMRVRRAGFRVGYEPAARIMHFEYGSTSPSGEASALYAKNHLVFVERHLEELGRSHLRPEDGALRARMRAASRRRILVLATGGEPKSIGAAAPMLRSLAGAGVFVTLGWISPTAEDGAVASQALLPTIEHADLSAPEKIAEFARRRAGYFDVLVIIGDGEDSQVSSASDSLRAVAPTRVDLRRMSSSSASAPKGRSMPATPPVDSATPR